MITRPEPEPGEDFAAYLVKWELIRLQANRFAEQNKKLLEFVKEIAKTDICSAGNHFDLTIEAEKILKEIGEL